MKVRFWGTRGLISTPGVHTAEFGGNTSCMQIYHQDQLIIVDTGFGVSNLGEELMERILVKNENLKIHIFFTHFHWDHIQGLPFFHPIYFPNSELHLYAPIPQDQLKRNVDILFDGSYSPFEGIENMPSKIVFHTLTKNYNLGNLSVDFIEVDHGEGQSEKTYAYKFSSPNSSLVIACDHEARPGKANDKLLEFSHKIPLLIHDAQYTDEEYVQRMGWGHSAVRAALENGLKAGVEKVLLTHHSPLRTDQDIRNLAQQFRSDKRYRKLTFEFAKEDVLYSVGKN